MVILGITSFLGSTSRIPLTACVFAVEALHGINNVLPIIIATTVAFLIVECSGLKDFTDTVIDAKLHNIAKGKKSKSIEVSLTVAHDSFVVGKEMRDILWPNSCVVVSFNRIEHLENNLEISAGDIITVKYITYDPAATIEEFKALVGEQSEDILRIMNPSL